MQVAAFSAKCPYEIGDKIQVIKEVNAGGRKQYMTEPATITDIACTHYLKAGKVKSKVFYLSKELPMCADLINLQDLLKDY